MGLGSYSQCLMAPERMLGSPRFSRRWCSEPGFRSSRATGQGYRTELGVRVSALPLTSCATSDKSSYLLEAQLPYLTM